MVLLMVALATLPLTEVVTRVLDLALAERGGRIYRPASFAGVGLGLAMLAGQEPLIGLAAAGLATFMRIAGLLMNSLGDFLIMKVATSSRNR